jgi:putative oxidoreductase
MSRGRTLSVALWGLQILLALLFAAAAIPKLSGAAAAVAMFATIGAGQWFRYFIGVIELAGAIGLLIPRLAGLAALGLVVDMIGATGVQIGVFHSNQLFPASVLVLCALVAWGRWPRTRALAGLLDRERRWAAPANLS